MMEPLVSELKSYVTGGTSADGTSSDHLMALYQSWRLAIEPPKKPVIFVETTSSVPSRDASSATTVQPAPNSSVNQRACRIVAARPESRW